MERKMIERVNARSCAMRGRGLENIQNIEVGGVTSNCITQVAKDSLYIARTIGEEHAQMEKVEDYLVNGFGVFKLSPRECGRLMGVKDSDIDKMFSVNSRTQCYKQFGNSIAVPVLMAIFSQLGLKGIRKWNDLSDKERYSLIEENMDFLDK